MGHFRRAGHSPREKVEGIERVYGAELMQIPLLRVAIH